jgi:steroid 5-alpha reductase family enzyme
MCSWFILAPVIISVYVLGLFILAQFKKDNSIADIGWAGGILLLTLSSFFLSAQWHLRTIIVTTLIFIWAVRLSSYTWWRHKGEDARYKKLRESWGEYAAVKAFINIFLLQGFLMIVIALPALVVNTAVQLPALGWLGVDAIILWIIGFLFEVIGDYQLYEFLADADNKGKILDTGLWRFTRHPNYFGESCMWWALFLLALPVTNGWVAIASPLTITGIFWFYMIELTERQFANNPAYQEYKRKTSAFWPRLPRN